MGSCCIANDEQYFDGVLCTPEGKAEKTPRVICLHEQDNGIGWKHTNWRTGRAVSTRRRELVVQFIITLANYDYIFNVRPLNSWDLQDIPLTKC